MKTVCIIRERGQLTIPESIRKAARWTAIGSVVSLSLENPQELLIAPHLGASNDQWDKLHELIKKARGIKGKGSVDASDFIARERGLR